MSIRAVRFNNPINPKKLDLSREYLYDTITFLSSLGKKSLSRMGKQLLNTFDPMECKILPKGIPLATTEMPWPSTLHVHKLSYRYKMVQSTKWTRGKSYLVTSPSHHVMYLVGMKTPSLKNILIASISRQLNEEISFRRKPIFIQGKLLDFFERYLTKRKEWNYIALIRTIFKNVSLDNQQFSEINLNSQDLTSMRLLQKCKEGAATVTAITIHIEWKKQHHTVRQSHYGDLLFYSRNVMDAFQVVYLLMLREYLQQNPSP